MTHHIFLEKLDLYMSVKMNIGNSEVIWSLQRGSPIIAASDWGGGGGGGG